MDGANWRPMQGSNPAAGGVDPNAPAEGDWREQLQPEARSRVVSKIMETLKKRLPVSGADGLNELHGIAARFEEKIYSVATSRSDYVRKISLKMLSMEMQTQQAPGYAQVLPNQNNPAQASTSSNAQTGHPGAGDWQEDTYQMIKSLKDQHFAELSALFNQICVNIQRVDNIIPPQNPSEFYKKMKRTKIMLDRILQLLLISKCSIQPATRDEVCQYEEQIISISTKSRAARTRFQRPVGQAPNSNDFQQQEPSPILSSMSKGLQSSSAAVIQHVPSPPTTNFSVPAQRNGANIQWNAGSYMEAAQGSNFNSLQYGSMGGGAALQQGSSWPMQGTMDAQKEM